MEIARIKVFSNKAVVESRGVIVAGTVGATVDIDYDTQWLDMDSRILVWRAGSVIKDDTACTGIVPREVLETSGQELFLGVYGTRGTAATPTLWACLGYIHAGADPSGDESTDPSLPVWAQADQKISLAQKAAQDAAASAAVKETFVAVYGQTGFADVKAAYDDGKACFCRFDGLLATLAEISNEKAEFTAWESYGIFYWITLTAEDQWSNDYEGRIKSKGISYASTDDQIPTAKAVYSALQAFEPELYIGYEGETTWGELSNQVSRGKLVFVQENKVTRRLHQYYGQDDSTGIMRFYRVDGEGIHWLAVDRENVWSSGEQTGNVFVGDANTTPQEIYDAFYAGKVCFVHRGNAGEGTVVYSAIPNSASAAALTRVTSYGQIEYGWLRSDGTFDKTTVSIVNSISASSRDNQIPTAKAVWDAVSGKVGQDALEEAVNDALTQAKESGEFDGAAGADGKSAYAFAQEGGYAGTEGEFAEKLAQEPELFLISNVNRPGNVTFDKTYGEIKTAYQAGKLVVMKYGNLLHYLVNYTPTGFVFYPVPTSYSSPSANKKWTVTSADVWSSENAGIPFATTEVTADSTDGALPTAKAVYDAIEAKFAAFTNVAEVGA